MAITPEPNRHVSINLIEAYFAQQLDGVLGVEGPPQGRLLISPSQQTLAIQVLDSGRSPNVLEYENLAFDVVIDQSGVWHQFAVHIDDNVDETYALLCAILDRVQLSDQPLADAIEESLGSLTGILAVRKALSHERQVGLFGELCVLVALVEALGASKAIDSWRGPMGEEHDFGIAEADVEVKTTLSERRHHWISTTTQLAPTGLRPLYLLSVQITVAAPDLGHSLPSLVSVARSALGSHSSQLAVVLDGMGYRDRDEDLYRSRWTYRTPPAFFEITSQFPAVTQERLNEAVPDASRVTDLRYRIDLTGIPPSTALFTIGEAVREGE